MNFKALTDQKRVVDLLVRTSDRMQLPNSYLFEGAEGVGKWATALALTAYLNCRDRADGDSCGVCPACRQIAKLQYPNLYIAVPTPPSKNEKEELANYWEVLEQKIAEPYSLLGGEREMSIPIDTVRTIKNSLAQKPPQDGYRVVIIDQMDRMRLTSADALLKLIEEPPSRTLIIITTSRPERLPATIISRCRRVRFGHLGEDDIRAYLMDISAVNDAQAQLLARLSQGSLGRALYIAGGETEQDREVAKLIFKGMFLADGVTVVAEATDVLPLKDRSRIARIIRNWQTLFRDLIALTNGRGGDDLVNVDFAVDLEKIAGHDIPPQNLLKVPGLMAEVLADLELNVDTQSAVGAMLIKVQKAVRG